MLPFIFSFVLTAASALLAFPAGVLLLELLAAIIIPPRKAASEAQHESRPRIAVLVPAHNESADILPTLNDIKQQLLATDRMLVVADNCTDDTAMIAAGIGAEVVVRNDKAKIGKGYALEFGLNHLSPNRPDVVIIIDADCRLSKGTIDRLATTCARTNRPTQALNLSTAPIHSQIDYGITEFAMRLKNWLRPRGLCALNLPCQLTGTGMAFPWKTIRKANVASGTIVEDLKLGLDLAQLGYPPLFCEAAKVTSDFPSTSSGAKSQRERWEAGHIRMILTAIPRYLSASLIGGNFALLVLALDLAVPPLSLYFSLISILVIVTGLAALFGMSFVPLTISVASVLAFAASLFIAYLKCGRDILPQRAFLLLMPFLVAKFPIYLNLVLNRATPRWIRTDRKKEQ